MSVGENIRRIREGCGMSQAELGRQVGVSAPMINQVERGVKNPSLQVGAEIARVLGVELEALLSEPERAKAVN